MARILCLQDAMDYLRLCDGEEDHAAAVKMLVRAYHEHKELHDALRATFAIEVQNASNHKLGDKEREITNLQESLELANWRLRGVRDASYATPEDEDDS